MATNVPPHNLSEICDGIVLVLDRPECTLEDLMEKVKGPDFPTGAHIWGKEGIRLAYATGRGRITVQARHEIEEIGKQERKRIVFTEIPFMVNKATTVARIAELVKTRKVDGISEVRDESDRKGMRVVVELRRGASPDVVINNLYKHTALRSAFSVNMLALVRGTPRTLALKDVIRYYIEFREEVVRRRAEFDLRKARARVHILEGLRIALQNLDRVIEIIRGSQDVDEARSNLMSEFTLSEIQAQAILDLQLRRLAALEQEKIENEYQELVALIAELEALLASPEKVRRVIRQETLELKRRFGDERQTQIHDQELGEWRREDTEPHQEIVITLSKNGYVKRVPAATYRAQHRGGKGVKGQRMTREDDVTPYLQVADTHDYLLFFTNRGRVFSTRAYDLEEQSRNSRGTPVQNLVSLEPRETVHAILTVGNLLEDVYLVLATRKGEVKRMHLPLLRNIRSSGLHAFRMDSGDELVAVGLAKPDQDIVMVSELGMAIRFPSENELRPDGKVMTAGVKPHGRIAGGVRGMRLDSGDRVVAMDIVPPDRSGSLLIVSRHGYGKISRLDAYRRQSRGGKGLITLKITPKNGKIAAASVISEEVRMDSEGKLFLLTDKAQVLRTNLSEIRSTGRITQGVILVAPEEGDAISAIRVIGSLRAPGEIVDPATLAAAEAAAQVDGAEGPDEPEDDDNGETVAEEEQAEEEEEEEEERGPKKSARKPAAKAKRGK
jgi:DNA gyrase subunit A